jgi:multiple sugar transport system permease protein
MYVGGIKKHPRIKTVIIYTALVFITIVAVFPLYWTFTTAFKNPKDAFTFPPKYLPLLQFKPSLYALRDLGLLPPLEGEGGAHSPTALINKLKNSFIVAVGSTGLSVFLGSLSSYALVRFRFYKWKNKDISFFILSQRMLPPIVLVIPFFILYSSLGLIDTLLGVILAHTLVNLPFVVWIMQGFFRGIPSGLIDSARIDGCSEFSTFWRIVMPLSLPGLAATCIFTTIFSWNELLFAISLTYRKAQTVPIAIAGLTHGSAALWWDISAVSIIALIPVFILVLFFQRHIVAGLTLGAIK